MSRMHLAVPPFNACRIRCVRLSSPRLKRISLLLGDQTGVNSDFATPMSVKRNTASSRDKSITQIVGKRVAGSSCLYNATYLSSGDRPNEMQSFCGPTVASNFPCRSTQVNCWCSAPLIEQHPIAGYREAALIPSPAADLRDDNRSLAAQFKAPRIEWLRHESAIVHE